MAPRVLEELGRVLALSKEQASKLVSHRMLLPLAACGSFILATSTARRPLAHDRWFLLHELSLNPGMAIRENRQSTVRCHEYLRLAREEMAKHVESSSDIVDKLRQILSPVQAWAACISAS